MFCTSECCDGGCTGSCFNCVASGVTVSGIADDRGPFGAIDTEGVCTVGGADSDAMRPTADARPTAPETSAMAATPAAARHSQPARRRLSATSSSIRGLSAGSTDTGSPASPSLLDASARASCFVSRSFCRRSASASAAASCTAASARSLAAIATVTAASCSSAAAAAACCINVTASTRSFKLATSQTAVRRSVAASLKRRSACALAASALERAAFSHSAFSASRATVSSCILAALDSASTSSRKESPPACAERARRSAASASASSASTRVRNAVACSLLASISQLTSRSRPRRRSLSPMARSAARSARSALASAAASSSLSPSDRSPAASSCAVSSAVRSSEHTAAPSPARGGVAATSARASPTA